MTGHRYQVVWARAAERDLERIVGFIAHDDVRTALRLLQELRRRAEALVTMPERGRVVPELRAQAIDMYRELIHKPWRIVYRIEAERVYVLAVIDARRNVEDLLLERLSQE